MLDGYFRNGEEFMEVLNATLEAYQLGRPFAVPNYRSLQVADVESVTILPGQQLDRLIFHSPKEVCQMMANTYNKMLEERKAMILQMSHYAILCRQQNQDEDLH